MIWQRNGKTVKEAPFICTRDVFDGVKSIQNFADFQSKHEKKVMARWMRHIISIFCGNWISN